MVHQNAGTLGQNFCPSPLFSHTQTPLPCVCAPPLSRPQLSTASFTVSVSFCATLSFTFDTLLSFFAFSSLPARFFVVYSDLGDLFSTYGRFTDTFVLWNFGDAKWKERLVLRPFGLFWASFGAKEKGKN